MSTKAYVKDSSAYSPSTPYVRDSGSWKPVTQILGKAGGVWSSVFASPGSIDRRFIANPGFGGEVENVALQSDGKILVGGAVTFFNGKRVNRLVRLNSDETLDTTFAINMGSGFNGSVLSIVLQSDDKILVGGNFTDFNGTTVNRLARLNSDGTLDTAFATNMGTGFSGIVFSIVLQSDDKILVGGAFSTLNGTTSGRLARLNSDGTLDTTFATNMGTGFNSTVYSIALQSDNKILVGGAFSTFNGTTSNRLARLNSDGTLDTAFTTNIGTGFNSTVYSIALQSDNKILVGGAFSTLNGTTSGRLARLNSDGTLDTAFTTNMGTNFSSYVFSIVLQSDDKILVGGRFASVNGTTSGRLARINSDGTLDTAFSANMGTGFGSDINSIALQSDGKILAGGISTSFNGGHSPTLVRLNSDGTVDSYFTTDTDPYTTPFIANAGIRSIELQSDGKILIAGSFTSFNGTTVNGFARLNSDETLDTAFATNIGTGFDSTVYSIVLQSDGKILAAGGFSTFNGTTANRLARLNSDGTLDTAFATNMGTGFNATVENVALQSDGKILVGGAFSTFNGTTVNRLARLNSDGTLDTAFATNMGTGFNSTVYSIALQSDGKILAVGEFYSFNETSSNRLARINSDGTLDTAFATNVGAGITTVPNQGYQAFGVASQPDGKVLVVGNFSYFHGADAGNFLRLNSDGTLDTAFMANIGRGFSGIVRFISLQSDGKILIAGDYGSNGYFNTKPVAGFVRLNSDGTPDVLFPIHPAVSPSRSVILTAKEVDGGNYLIAGSDGNFGLGPNYNGLIYFNL